MIRNEEKFVLVNLMAEEGMDALDTLKKLRPFITRRQRDQLFKILRAYADQLKEIANDLAVGD